MRERTFSLGRSCLMALVLILHIVMLCYLLLPPAWRGWRDSHRISAAGALHVRFFLSPVRDHPIPVVTAKRRAKANRSGVMKHRLTRAMILRESTSLRAVLVASRVGLATTPAPHTIMVLVPLPGADYIPGGGVFQQGADAHFSRQNVRVPSDSFVSHAPRFRMTDPRMQGLSGAVRAVGSMLGAVDPNCLDLDAWRGMTPTELIEHHAPSEEKMQKIADKHHCIAPR